MGTFTTGFGWTAGGTLNIAIPDNSATGISHTTNVNDGLIIEAVQIQVNLDHTFTGELAIELTSPSGTKSMLFNPINGFGSSDDLAYFVLLSNAFYGESGRGNWTIKIVDTLSGDTGILTDWMIRIFGHY